MTRLRIVLAALAALLLLTSACGGDDDPTDPPSADDGGDQGTASDDASAAAGAATAEVPDPCGFLTPAELEGIFGTPFGEGTLADDPETTGTRQCTWAGTDATTAAVVSIAVGTDASQRAGMIGRGAEEMFDLTRAAHDRSDAITAPDLGLGDRSYGTGSGIYVLVGDTSYAFSVTGSSPEVADQLRELAERVVAR